MQRPIIELATIRLASGKTEEDLVRASNVFQTEFLSRQPGFLRRELTRKSPGIYVDVVHWRSAEEAHAIMEKIGPSAACQAYFSVMDLGGLDPEQGVEHLMSIAAYTPSPD